MTATINATTSTGVVVTSDTSGALALQTANTTAMTISSAQVVNFVNSFTVAGSPLASGAMTLISTQTASSSATIAWTSLSGYNHYMLIIDGLIPASTSYLQLQFGTGSGPTYVTSGYYFVQSNTYANNGTFATSNFGDSGSSTQINIGGGNGTNELQGTYTVFNATYTIYNMTNSKDTYIGGTNAYNNNGGSRTFASVITGQLNTNSTAKTAIKLFLSTGNITSGTFSLYGVSS
jgi:hypothetical protein